MGYLFLSIVFGTSIYLIFKVFGNKGIDNLQAIVVNYLTAATLGFFISPFSISTLMEAGWLSIGAITGVLFLVMFNIVASTTQKMGVAIASIATKVSMVIPVIVAVVLYGDSMPVLKIVGIVLAIVAVVLSFWQTSNTQKINGKFMVLPAVLFLGTGAIDALIKHAQEKYLGVDEFSHYISFLFLMAAITGLVGLFAKNAMYKNKLHAKSLLAGIILGIPNYFAVYFLLKTFAHSGLQSSVVFPVNNIGIVLLSVLLAVSLFKEKLNMLNKIGVVLTVCSIAIVYSS